MGKHWVTRENDEYVCSCGLRWDIDEDDPHPATPEEHLEIMREKLRNSEDVSE